MGVKYRLSTQQKLEIVFLKGTVGLDSSEIGKHLGVSVLHVNAFLKVHYNDNPGEHERGMRAVRELARTLGPELEVQVARLAFIEGLTYRQIAEKLEIPREPVKNFIDYKLAERPGLRDAFEDAKAARRERERVEQSDSELRQLGRIA